MKLVCLGYRQNGAQQASQKSITILKSIPVDGARGIGHIVSRCASCTTQLLLIG